MASIQSVYQAVVLSSRVVAVSMIVLLLTSSGCSTTSPQRDIRTAFFQGDLAAAERMIYDELQRESHDRDCLQLDLAMVDLVQGRLVESEAKLRVLRDTWDTAKPMHLGEAGLSLVSDDRQLAYAGEPYERVFLRTLMALTSLVGNGEDAYAYCLQAEEEQVEQLRVEAGPEAEGRPATDRVALAPYLLGILQEESHLQYGDAARAFSTVAAWEPGFQLARHDVERVTERTHSPPGMGVVYVIAFVGRGPQKIQTTAPVTSEALLLADRLLSEMGEYTLPPTVAPVKIPTVQIEGGPKDTIEVDAGGHLLGRTETITDFDRLALARHEQTRHRVLARAVVRRIVKKAAIRQTKEALNVENPTANVLMDLAGIAWEAGEEADTRGWNLLPAQVQIQRFVLPVGDHQLGMRSAGATRVGRRFTADVRVEDGRNTYVMGWFPGSAMTGRLLASATAH